MERQGSHLGFPGMAVSDGHGKEFYEYETPPLLEGHLDRIGKEKLLTHREETELSRRTKAGDERARKRLIERNLRLVVSVAKRYMPCSRISWASARLTDSQREHSASASSGSAWPSAIRAATVRPILPPKALVSLRMCSRMSSCAQSVCGKGTSEETVERKLSITTAALLGHQR